MTITEVNDLCKRMRAAGYAAVVFSPEEVDEKNIRGLQDYLIEQGNLWLSQLDEDEDEDEDIL